MNQAPRDLMASVVVFLVALPLCLGVALASGVPPALGIASGIIGGIIVGALAGSPLQVSGPAAGLVVSVWMVVDGWGVAALGVAVLLSGALQIGAAMLKLGRWFRAVSPALIQGMLAGIGVLIAASQLHVMVGATPPGGGLADLWALPGAWSQALSEGAGAACALGLTTIAILFLWDRFRPKKLAMVPGPLVAVGVVTIAAAVLHLDVAKVVLPASLLDSLNVPTAASFSLLLDLKFVGAAVALGLIAAAESLLCANATDALHKGPSTDYDKELLALGVGNIAAGAIGALPVTGVIVRSATNIEAGAKTRLSAIAHGFLLLVLVVAAPNFLSVIPVAALAGTLVFVGAKLAAPSKVIALYRQGQGEVVVLLVTVAAIATTGLLTGIAIGLAVSVLKLLWAFSHLDVDLEQSGDRYDVDAHGAATFVMLPKLAAVLESIPLEAEVHVHLGGLAYIDHACAELLERQQSRREDAGGSMVTEWDEVHRLREARPLVRSGKSHESGQALRKAFPISEPQPT